jgi:hypothetical protein
VATLPESVDYTDKDFDALRARLIALVKSVFPDWTDFDVASFGNLLVELYAFVGDVLTFYQDNLARESRLVTATQRKSVMALAKMLGYRLQGAQAATADVLVQLVRPPAASVTIPAGTVLRTQEVTEPVRFQLLAPAVIAPGADPVDSCGSRTVRNSSTKPRKTWSRCRASRPTGTCFASGWFPTCTAARTKSAPRMTSWSAPSVASRADAR